MKRSSGIIVTGLSATLVSAGWIAGVAHGSAPDTVAVDAASSTDTTAAGTVAAPDASAAAEDTAPESSPTATATADPSPTPTATGATGTFTGEAVATRYGDFQASITVADGVVTAIDWLQSGESDHRSQRINAQAIPVLEARILEAQSVDVGYISGASFTSAGVESAVESAMRAAGLA